MTRTRRSFDSPTLHFSLEHLEARIALAATEMPAITGSVYADDDGDGTVGPSEALEGVNIQLVRDVDRDLVYTAGIDRVEAAQSTSAEGIYCFGSLDPDAAYFVVRDQQTVDNRVLESVISPAIFPARIGGVIDLFRTRQIATAAPPAPSSAEAVLSFSNEREVMGRERDLLVRLTQGLGDVSAAVNRFGLEELLDFNNAPGVRGQQVVTWDGIDADASQLDFGLDGHDLTRGGADSGIVLRGGVDAAGEEILVTLRLYESNVSTSSEYSFPLPVTGGDASGFIFAPFADFVGDASPTRIDAMQMVIDGGAAGTDGKIALIGTLGPKVFDIPEVDTADLSIAKTNGVDALIPGEPTSYLVTVRNNGPAIVQGARLRDTFPDTLTDVQYAVHSMQGQVSGATVSGSGAIDDRLTMSPNSSITYRITARVRDDASSPISNRAEIVPPPGVIDPEVTNNTAIDSDPLGTSVDLQVTKDDARREVIVGDQITYRINVRNNGPVSVQGARVVDNFPATLDDVTYVSQGSAGTGGNTAAGEGNIDDTVDLPVGSVISYVVTATVSDRAVGTLANLAIVEPPDGLVDTNPGNNTETDVNLVRREVTDVAVTKTNGLSALVAGQEVIYTMVVSNPGPSNAARVNVVDEISEELVNPRYTSQMTGGASGATPAGVGNIDDLVDLPAGASIIYTLTATVASDARGTVENTVSASVPSSDINPANNTAIDIDPLVARADLAITKSDGQSSTRPGETLTYQIVVTNNGPSAVEGARIDDPVPDNLTDFQYTRTGLNEPLTADGPIADSIDLAVGQQVVYTVTATVAADAAGSVSNTATVAPPEEILDPNPSNNIATDTNSIGRALVDATVRKFSDPPIAVPGRGLRYTLVVVNAGQTTLDQTRLQDEFPDDLVDVRYTSQTQGQVAGNTETGVGDIDDLLNLAPGASVIYTVDATVRPGTTASALQNIASVDTGEQVDNHPADNFDVDVVAIQPQADLVVRKTDGQSEVQVGQQISYDVTVENRGPSDVRGARIRDSVPPGLTDVEFTSSATGGVTGNTVDGSGNIDDTVELPVGGRITYSITGTVADLVAGVLTNEATVRGPLESGFIELDDTNNVAVDRNRIETLTILGSEPTIIHEDAIAEPGQADRFQVTAHSTGKMIVNTHFTHALGDLQISLFDVQGNLIASSQTATDNEQLVVPVVAQQTYFLNISAAQPDEVNRYALEIENFPVPPPHVVRLAPETDSGMMDNDSVTRQAAPKIIVQADLADFLAMGISLLEPLDPQADSTQLPDEDGVAIAVGIRNVDSGDSIRGFATAVGDSGELFAFTPSERTTLTDGRYLVTAQVEVVDAAATPARGQSALADPHWVTIDQTPPATADRPLLLAASDSGVSQSDHVTSTTRPTLTGVGEAGSKVRLYAERSDGQAEQVGQTVARSNGRWEITSEPLVDGTYTFRAEYEDLAGNVSASGEPLVVEVDTLGPNTPFLDLLASADTGASSSDNVTSANELLFSMTTSDPGSHELPFNYRFRLYVRPDAEQGPASGQEVLIYDSANDAELPVGNLLDGLTDLSQLTRSVGPLPDGVHNFKLEVEDRAGNISADFLLDVTIDSASPSADMRMQPSSDSGTFSDDHVTNKMSTVWDGISEVGATVELFAGGRLLGRGQVGSDASDGVLGDGRGTWQVRSEPLTDGRYRVSARFEDVAGNSSVSDVVSIHVDSRPPNVPQLALVTDSGFDPLDRVTNIANAEITITASATDDGGLNPFPHDIEFRVYDRPGDVAGERLLIDSFGAFQGLTENGRFTETLPELEDGVHNLKVEVEDRAGNVSQAFLTDVVIDTQSPASADFSLLSSSDSGMVGDDAVTKLTEPTFAGVSTVGDQVRLYANEQLVGTATVQSDESDGVAGDGLGRWGITSKPLTDGQYAMRIEAEDLAGNRTVSPAQTVFVDTQAPNQPFLDLLDDTGWDELDNVTSDPTPRVAVVLNDTIAGGDNPLPHDIQYRIYDRAAGGNGERLLVDSFADAGEFVTDGQAEVTLPALADGTHNLKLEVEDRAGNRSTPFLLQIQVDTTGPELDDAQLDLADYADSGMSQVDNVTRVDRPAILGYGPVGNHVVVTANGEIAGQGRIGSDLSDDTVGDGRGAWEVTLEPLDDGVYEIEALIEDRAGNSAATELLVIEIDTLAPNTPFVDLAEFSDTGRHNDDQVTRSDPIGVSLTTTDPNAKNHQVLFPEGHNLKFRLYDRPESGNEILVYDSALDESLGRVDGLTADSLVATTIELEEGWHNLKLEVEDRAGNISADQLSDLLIDRTAFAGTIQLASDSDSGVPGDPATFGDGITRDLTPTFTGTAEANSLVTLTIDGTSAGTTVAVPLDGDDAVQPPGQPYALSGNWTIQSTVALGQGPHQVVVTFEDLAGNRAESETQVVVDSSGPRVINVTRFENGFPSLFDPKPTSGPDPLISSIVVHVMTGPEGELSALAPATATEEGHYRLVGDANGPMAIEAVELLTPKAENDVTQIVLRFAEPLPDDRFTLIVSDGITDLGGNALDGESGAQAPFEGAAGQSELPPIFPTGDGHAGGDFVARFTVDSRPEIGTWGAGSVWVDINGDWQFNPESRIDAVNRDIVYRYGFASDDIFAGNFALPGELTDGFDKVAAYGRAEGQFRWLVDTDNDGVPNIDRIEPLAANGRPVAGNFDGNIENGDEVAVFDGSSWYFDTDHNFRTDTVLPSFLVGYPIVADFDGDGFDDLATWADNQFMLDLTGGAARAWDGFADEVIRFGFIGVRERPVAADVDQDGFADLGLWVPDREGQTDRDESEWYFLVSNGHSLLQRLSPPDDPIDSFPVIDFTPIPFGPDIFAQFGDEFAEPIVGNFDPPTVISPSPASSSQWTNQANSLDVNNDRFVSPLDALSVINELNRTGPRQLFDRTEPDGHYLDTNQDGFLSPLDALLVLNHLNEANTVATRVSQPVSAVPSAHVFPAGRSVTGQAAIRREMARSAHDALELVDRDISEFQSACPADFAFQSADSPRPERWDLLTWLPSGQDWDSLVERLALDAQTGYNDAFERNTNSGIDAVERLLGWLP